MIKTRTIEYSIGALIVLNGMAENPRNSILATLTRIASPQLNGVKLKRMSSDEHTYFFAPNSEYRVIVKMDSDKITVDNIVSKRLIDAFGQS